jgi:threonine dehydratase
VSVPPPLLTPDDVRRAAERVSGLVRRTPLVPTSAPGLWLKLENTQRAGAFKARGAAAALSALPPGVRARGVVTHSSGNHGRALAEVGAALGVPVTVVVPATAPPHKVAAVRRAGATVQVVDPAAREQAAAAHVARGLLLVPPFDHDDVIAGQGTVGLEIAEQAAEQGLLLQAVLVPVGGGGLAGGVAAALAGRPVAVVGVEPELAADLVDSLRQGTRVAWSLAQVNRTMADGLRLPAVGERPWQHIRDLGVVATTVTEQQIADACRWLAAQGVTAEPSGAVSVAAALRRRRPPRVVEVAVVSGGNVAPTLDADPRE